MGSGFSQFLPSITLGLSRLHSTHFRPCWHCWSITPCIFTLSALMWAFPLPKMSSSKFFLVKIYASFKMKPSCLLLWNFSLFKDILSLSILCFVKVTFDMKPSSRPGVSALIVYISASVEIVSSLSKKDRLSYLCVSIAGLTRCPPHITCPRNIQWTNLYFSGHPSCCFRSMFYVLQLQTQSLRFLCI